MTSALLACDPEAQLMPERSTLLAAIPCWVVAGSGSICCIAMSATAICSARGEAAGSAAM